MIKFIALNFEKLKKISFGVKLYNKFIMNYPEFTYCTTLNPILESLPSNYKVEVAKKSNNLTKYCKKKK